MSRRGLEIVSSKDPRKFFAVGEQVPDSGIYRVFHSGHRVSHDVTLIRGEKFPPCEKCESDVHFELLRAAPQIAHDANFMGKPIRLYQLPHPDDEQQQPVKRVI